MRNVTVMKKVISAILLGSLLVTGAVVYADTLSETDGTRDRQTPPGTEQRVDRDSELLDTLVTEGVITAAEKTTVEKALEAQRAERDAEREAAKAAGTQPTPPEREKPEAGTKPVSHFARMAEDGLISEALANKIDTYLTAQREAAFAAEVKPLVDAGTFKDADAVHTALDGVREAMKEQMDALKPDTTVEKVDFKSLTEAERTALREKMDAERTAMQAKHEAAIEEVYSALVADGTLTQAQADALQALMKDHMADGQGRGPGGMGGPGHGPGRSADTTQ